MSALPRLIPSRLTVGEFLDWPGDGSGRKFELVDGAPQAMAPASISHGTIQATLARLSGKSPRRDWLPRRDRAGRRPSDQG